MNEHNVWEFYQGQAAEGFKESYARLSYLVKLIPKEAYVLNIGIGDGSFEKLAVQAGLKVASLDPDLQSTQRLSESLGIKTYCATLENIPEEEDVFDVVVLSEVLEHLTAQQSQTALQECRRILKNGGKLIGTVPADEDLSSSMVACPHCASKFHRWGHCQSFTKIELESLLKNYFSIGQISYRKFVPWKFRKLPYIISGLLKVALMRLGFKVQNSNYVFIATKK